MGRRILVPALQHPHEAREHVYRALPTLVAPRVTDFTRELLHPVGLLLERSEVGVLSYSRVGLPRCLKCSEGRRGCPERELAAGVAQLALLVGLGGSQGSRLLIVCESEWEIPFGDVYCRTVGVIDRFRIVDP